MLAGGAKVPVVEEKKPSGKENKEPKTARNRDNDSDGEYSGQSLYLLNYFSIKIIFHYSGNESDNDAANDMDDMDRSSDPDDKKISSQDDDMEWEK